MEFRKLRLSDREPYERLKENLPDITGWEYSFDVLWIWDVRESVEVCCGADFMYLMSVSRGEKVFYPPLVADPADTGRAVDELAAYARENGFPFRMFGINKALLPYIDTEKYAAEADRDSFDYIYSAEALMTLTGKKYHSKRNYITRFKAQYSYEFRAYVPADLAAIEALYDRWTTESDHETLRLERSAILRALKFCEALGLKIYVLEVGKELIAFSVTALDARGVAHGIFEKGDTRYEGVYQMITWLTAGACFAGYSVVNREEDMGIEGLRKAKLSYNPLYLYEKYVLTER